MRRGILILTFLAPFITLAQTPLHEMRGVWMTTVHNIDWPSKPGLDAATQQKEFEEWIQLFDTLQLNSVFVQVRPAGDLLYPSKLEPWSRFLTGKTGSPPTPFYDPLDFMVNTCHDQGKEFHAWLNPYRIHYTDAHDSLSAVKQDWLLDYGNTKLLNPGLPEVMDHITAIVVELITNYDVDGIHFDDYFYPYPKEGATIDDAETYSKYADSTQSPEDWRRENVNQLIKKVSDTIRALNPDVKFGVSPFGIWRNKVDDISGSATRGLSGFDAIYADSKKWIQHKWVDYLAPQLYWSRQNPIASFDTLAAWWNELAPEHNLYAGLALYKVDNNDDPAWENPDEMIEQINHIREKEQFSGVIFFSASKLKANKLNIIESLKNTFPHPALGAQYPGQKKIPNPSDGVWSLPHDKGMKVHWKPIDTDQNPRQWVIYRLGENENTAGQPNQIVKIVSGNQTSWYDPEGHPKDVYAIKAISASHFQSEGVYTPREMMVEAPVQSLKLQQRKAILTRAWEKELSAGTYTLHIKGLSANADLQDLHIAEGQQLEVAAYEHNTYVDSSMLEQKQHWEQNLTQVESHLSAYLDSLEVLDRIDQLLSSGFTNVSGTTGGDDTEKMDELIQYYQQRFLDIHQRERRYKQYCDSLRKKRNTLHHRLTSLERDKKLLRQQLYVAMKVKSSGKQQLTFEYPVSGVDHQVRRTLEVRDTTVRMQATASVQQTTQIDWYDIAVYLQMADTDLVSSTAKNQHTRATITSEASPRSLRFPVEEQSLENTFDLYSDSLLTDAVRHIAFDVPTHWQYGNWSVKNKGQSLPSPDKAAMQKGRVSVTTGIDPNVHLISKKDSLIQKNRYIYKRKICLSTFEVGNNYPFDVKVALYTPKARKRKTAVMPSTPHHYKKSDYIVWYWNIKARENEKMRVISDKRQWFWQ